MTVTFANHRFDGESVTVPPEPPPLWAWVLVTLAAAVLVTEATRLIVQASL